MLLDMKTTDEATCIPQLSKHLFLRRFEYQNGE
jgi:hypothetical protein